MAGRFGRLIVLCCVLLTAPVDRAAAVGETVALAGRLGLACYERATREKLQTYLVEEASGGQGFLDRANALIRVKRCLNLAPGTQVVVVWESDGSPWVQIDAAGVVLWMHAVDVFGFDEAMRRLERANVNGR